VRVRACVRLAVLLLACAATMQVRGEIGHKCDAINITPQRKCNFRESETVLECTADASVMWWRLNLALKSRFNGGCRQV
jgi:hypothetical protein